MENTIQLAVGVKILLVNKSKKYLLLHRSLKKYPEVKGRWDIVGGRIKSGKTLLENLAREVDEETGLKLVGAPKLIAAQDILRIAGRHTVRLTYLGKASGEIKLDEEENDKYKWYSKKELMKLRDVDIYFKKLLNSGFRDWSS